jgi:hypothetical protein
MKPRLYTAESRAEGLSEVRHLVMLHTAAAVSLIPKRLQRPRPALLLSSHGFPAAICRRSRTSVTASGFRWQGSRLGRSVLSKAYRRIPMTTTPG